MWLQTVQRSLCRLATWLVHIVNSGCGGSSSLRSCSRAACAYCALTVSPSTRVPFPKMLGLNSPLLFVAAAPRLDQLVQDLLLLVLPSPGSQTAAYEWRCGGVTPVQPATSLQPPLHYLYVAALINDTGRRRSWYITVIRGGAATAISHPFCRNLQCVNICHVGHTLKELSKHVQVESAATSCCAAATVPEVSYPSGEALTCS